VQAPPDLWADGDRALVVQVLTNLLANCSRHAPGSTVWLTARRCGERAVLEVRDNGPGVPDGAEEAVFGRGVRDPSTGGEGLGLFLCRRLLAANGGTARLRQGDGPPEAPGCVVTVELGAAPPPALPLPQPMLTVVYPLDSTRLSA
jgi:two-component system, OmpR family, sensor kinase